jgi:mRNA-decapping enzyme subunit 2
VPVYGGIILNAAMDKCLLVKGWSKNATWGFPKGKVNKNEMEMACAAREVYEEVRNCTFNVVCIILISSPAISQVGFDVSQFINEDDTITATINNNDNEQTIKLYIISGVPENTVFETQTRKEIR